MVTDLFHIPYILLSIRGLIFVISILLLLFISVSEVTYKSLPLFATEVLTYLNDGLTALKFSLEKTLELTVEFHCHQPKRFDESNYNKG